MDIQKVLKNMEKEAKIETLEEAICLLRGMIRALQEGHDLSATPEIREAEERAVEQPPVGDPVTDGLPLFADRFDETHIGRKTWETLTRHGGKRKVVLEYVASVIHRNPVEGGKVSSKDLFRFLNKERKVRLNKSTKASLANVFSKAMRELQSEKPPFPVWVTKIGTEVSCSGKKKGHYNVFHVCRPDAGSSAEEGGVDA